MMPTDDPCCEEVNPLEVNKVKVSGPAALIIETPATWELKITVINNLEPVDDIADEPEEPLVYYSTRGAGKEDEIPGITQSNTITDVVVKDTLPVEFKLMKFSPSQGNIIIDGTGETKLTWNVGNLKPKAKATLELEVVIANDVFTRPGSYVLNSGATATGLLHPTQEVLTDGPTKSIIISVTDGTPNETPIAIAGVDQMTFEGNPAYLDGSGSYDLDGTVVKHTWYLGEEYLGCSETMMTYLDEGVHVITLVVEDNRKATASDEVTVKVYKENAEIGGGVLQGTVIDATTRRGFDPYIVVSNDDFEISTWTDMGGNYRLIGIPEGHYEVFCQSEGYQDFHGEVYIGENEEVNYDIYMLRE